MKKFKVTIPCEYVQGHLRNGIANAIIEAEDFEEATQKALEYDDYDIEVLDYSIEDYQLDYNSAKIKEIKEED